MTFKEFLIEHLTGSGMFDSQAEKVFAVVEADPANETMKYRWNDNIADYPDLMQPLVRLIANRAALKWTEENLPEAWFKPMFMSGEERERFFEGKGRKVLDKT